MVLFYFKYIYMYGFFFLISKLQLLKNIKQFLFLGSVLE